MAGEALSRNENVDGDFFVDSTCIDCDTCRWMAPATFDRSGGRSRVHRQPVDEGEVTSALLALVSCPTSSIGTRSKHPVAEVAKRLPLPVEEGAGVFHCGYHDESSFGAASYLIVRPAGNVLVDCPRFARPLVRRIEELGGVDTLFLTHRDDVGDHARFREHFECERVLHRADAHTEELAGVECLIDGEGPMALDDEIQLIPVPGHTEGSTCLLYRGSFLFTGDHLAWSADLEQLYAFRSACWYDWDTQIASMKRLAEYAFDWVLPGHGRRARVGRANAAARMQECVDWMAG
ncbi:MAG: MBL fold metallo-hydrolase [Planctomycetota bacterium]